MFAGVKTLDRSLLQTCSNMSAGLEVRSRQLFLWEESITTAFAAWRLAIAEGGVRVFGDLTKGEFRFETLP
jgi:hypothetical protein